MSPENEPGVETMRQILLRELKRRRRGIKPGEQVTVDSPGRIDPAYVTVGQARVAVQYFEYGGWCVVAIRNQIEFEQIGDRDLFEMVEALAQRLYRRGGDLTTRRPPGPDLPDDNLPSPFRKTTRRPKP